MEGRLTLEWMTSANDAAGVIDVWPPIPPLEQGTFARAISNHTVAERPLVKAPGVSSTVMIDVVGVEACMISSLFAPQEKTIVITSEKW